MRMVRCGGAVLAAWLAMSASGVPATAAGEERPRATVPIEMGPGVSPQVAALVFRAAIDTERQSFGDSEGVEKLLALRAQRRAREAAQAAPRD
jgi:hypothetical protein